MGFGFTMRELLYVVLLACLLTGEAASALRHRQPKRDDQAKLFKEKILNEASRKIWSTAEIDSTTLTSSTVRLSNGTELQISPLISQEPLFRHANSTRRKLGDFRECSPCTCCDSTRRWCLPTVCCYDINCSIRGSPFGLCSFTPISCTCFGCRD